jgi:hypothetical protein
MTPIMRLLLALLLIGLDVRAQDRAGGIAGTITDPDGRAVVNTPVQAINIATATVYRANTSASGYYALARLPVGTYTLVVPDVGFTLVRFERKSNLVQAELALRIDIRLQWGGNLGTPGDDQSAFNLAKSKAQPGPAPRTREGKPDFSGVWIGSFDPNPEVPTLLPWAEKLTKDRMANDGRDSPSTFCLPPFIFPGGPLIYKVVQTPALLITLFENVPNYRQVYLDGRAHPKEPNPSWLGHSTGTWQRDTLVIDTLGFNDKSWLGMGYPHTEMLHVIERYRRPDRGHLEVEVTIEDAGTFDKSWKQRSTWYLAPEDDVLEYVCSENNNDPQHMTRK